MSSRRHVDPQERHERDLRRIGGQPEVVQHPRPEGGESRLDVSEVLRADHGGPPGSPRPLAAGAAAAPPAAPPVLAGPRPPPLPTYAQTLPPTSTSTSWVTSCRS